MAEHGQARLFQHGAGQAVVVAGDNFGTGRPACPAQSGQQTRSAFGRQGRGVVEEIAEDNQAPCSGCLQGVLQTGQIGRIRTGGDRQAALLHGLGFAQVQIGGQEGLMLRKPRAAVAPQNDGTRTGFANHLLY